MKRGSKVFFKETTRPIARKKTGEETREVKGYTFRVSNMLTQPITERVELSLFNDGDNLTGENRVRIIDANTEETIDRLPSPVNDILLYFGMKINEISERPDVKEYIQKLQGVILRRRERKDGAEGYELGGITLNLNLKKMVQEIYGLDKSGDGGGKNELLLAIALDAGRRYAFDAIFYEGQGKSRTIKRRMKVGFYTIRYYTDNKRKVIREVSLRDEKGELVKDENGKMVKKEETINIYYDFDVRLDDEFFWFLYGYYLLPTNIFKLKREARYPTNDLATYLFTKLTRERGNIIRWCERSVKAKEKELQQDTSLTKKERIEQLRKYERECLTFTIGVPTILASIQGNTYWKTKKGNKYTRWERFNDHLKKTVRGLKDIGIITEFYERSARDKSRVLCFVINKNWLDEQKSKMLDAPLSDEYVGFEEVS